MMLIAKRVEADGSGMVVGVPMTSISLIVGLGFLPAEGGTV